jgi:hypothetical protein
MEDGTSKMAVRGGVAILNPLSSILAGLTAVLSTELQVL